MESPWPGQNPDLNLTEMLGDDLKETVSEALQMSQSKK